MVFFETIALASTYLSVWLLHLWRGELVPERCMQWPRRASLDSVLRQGVRGV